MFHRRFSDTFSTGQLSSATIFPDFGHLPIAFSSFAITGTRLPSVLLSFGVFGDTPWPTGRAESTDQERLAVDLVLNGYLVGGPSAPLDAAIRDALREHAERNAINTVQLWNERRPVLAEVLAALTPEEGTVQESSISTISLRLVDASKFMAGLAFPNSPTFASRRELWSPIGHGLGSSLPR